MRILIDECIPRRFISVFSQYEAVSVPYMGWSGKKNGELMKLMIEAKFDVFVTVDQNIQYQQNMKNMAISILVLHGETNSYEDLLSLVSKIRGTLTSIKKGMIYVID